MLDYAQLLGMNGGNAQAATLMQGALQPGASMLNAAGPTPVGQNPMTGGPSRFSMGTAIGEAGQAGTLMGQAAQQVASAPPRPAPIAPIQAPPPQQPVQQNNGMIVGYQPGALKPANSYLPGAQGMDGLYVDPMGQVYKYDPATQNMSPWTGRENMSYGVNDGGGE